MQTQAHTQQMIGIGQSYGTFGELLQGMGTDNLDFLVTLPIQRFSHARFLSDPHLQKLTVSPSSKYKTQHLATLMLQHYNLPQGGLLEIESNIPVGKGLSSSSADLVATARAISQCFNLELTNTQIQHFLRQIEPTDGVMYEGVVSFYHRLVQLCAKLGTLPALTIVAIDEGGEVDTIEFNKQEKVFTENDKQEYDQLLRSLVTAIQEQDIQTIGKIATRSAILNQKHCHKRYLSLALDVCQQVNALGVVVTHSGTCLGLLLSPNHENYYQQIHSIYEHFQHKIQHITLYHSSIN